MTWESVETARCERCRIYTPRGDLVFGPDGKAYCCGVPESAYRTSARVEDSWVTVRHRTPIERTTRLVIGAMLAMTIAFPLAACCSQL